MYGPDSYLYETNLALLAELSDEELADPALVAQLTPDATVLAELTGWLADRAIRGLAALAEWFAPPAEVVESVPAQWLYPPLY